MLADTTEFATNTDPLGRFGQIIRMIQALTQGAYNGATDYTLFMGGMGHDNQQGCMSLNPETDGLTFTWTNPVDPDQNAYQNQMFLKATTNLKGVFIEVKKNPFP